LPLKVIFTYFLQTPFINFPTFPSFSQNYSTRFPIHPIFTTSFIQIPTYHINNHNFSKLYSNTIHNLLFYLSSPTFHLFLQKNNIFSHHILHLFHLTLINYSNFISFTFKYYPIHSSSLIHLPLSQFLYKQCTFFHLTQISSPIANHHQQKTQFLFQTLLTIPQLPLPFITLSRNS